MAFYGDDNASTISGAYSVGQSSVEMLPNLPGYRPNRSQNTRKANALKYYEGQPFIEDNSRSRVGMGGGGSVSRQSLVDSRSQTSLVLGKGKPLHSAQATSLPSPMRVPPVLQFLGYFKEAVHESNLENHRIRKCEIFYYLEDDSIQINEQKTENSGVPQGNFMKRHQVPKDEDTFYTLADIEIGGELTLYGRTFQIIDANPSTKSYLKFKEDGSESVGFPVDKFEVDRAALMSRETGADLTVRHNIRKNPMKNFAEAALGNTCDNSGREGFLKYDRKVLRFTCFWDDREALYGDMQKFKLHYFLTDNTIEVLQIYGTNCGRDPYPLLIKRAKIPKSLDDEAAGFYHWSDLDIGTLIDVYGRRIQIVDADEFTREWMENEGIPLTAPLQPPEDEAPKFERILPPYTGYGSEEDSLTSCVGSLVQTAPKKLPGTDRTLRYLGRLKSAQPEDEGREFVLQFFCTDNTLAIREPPQRNSGIVGGNFLKRGTSQVKDDYDNPITPGSLYIGAEVATQGYVFVVTDSDDSTLKYMETEPETFPYSDYNAVISRWGRVIVAIHMAEFEEKAEKIASETGLLSLSALKSLLSDYQGLCEQPDQAPITVMRKLGNGEFSVSVEALMQQLKASVSAYNVGGKMY